MTHSNLPTRMTNKLKYKLDTKGWPILLGSFLLVLTMLGLPVALTMDSDSAVYRALASDSPGSDAVAVEPSELQAAVSAAIRQIESEAYTAHQLTLLDDVIAESERVLHHPDGSFEIVKELDPHVAHELTSFGNSDRSVEEADHEYEETTILVHLDGVVYEGREGDTWNPMEVSPRFRPLAIDLGGMAKGEYTQTNQDSTFNASRIPTEDGGTVWTFSHTIDGSTSRQIWEVHQEGYLRSYTLEFAEKAAKGQITFMPLTEPPAIAEPQVGEAVDPEALGLAKLDTRP